MTEEELSNKAIPKNLEDDIVAIAAYKQGYEQGKREGNSGRIGYQKGYREGVEATITGDTSDGYHTFNELYEYRKVYNALLFNEWYSVGKYDVHKSWKHSDGKKCFGGGWFIVVAQLPTGQVSNHYEAKDWDLFQIPEREKAAEYDGHTPQQSLERMTQLLADKGGYKMYPPQQEGGENE